MKRWLDRLLGHGVVATPVQKATADWSHVERLLAEGHRLEDTGQFADAEARYREALQISPEWARVWLNLGNVQFAQEQIDDAIASYHEALRRDPDYGAVYANLGKLYLDQQHYSEAAAHYAIAARLMPNSVDCVMGLGSALEEAGRHDEALGAYRQALTIDPDLTRAKLNLGRMLLVLAQPEEAEIYLQDILAEFPDNVLVHASLGQAMMSLGLIPEGLNHFRRAAQLEPQAPELTRILILFMNCFPDYTQQELFAAHIEYTQRFYSVCYPKNPSYSNSPDPERILRVGYVSSDFRKHAVSRFIEPVLVHHDRERIEVHCFYNYIASDGITDRLKNLVEAWHPIAKMQDEDVVSLVRDLGIDLLIDLSGYTEGHRLPVFAYKPAPVQATWLGYLATTGLATMDYRICDAYTDPPGLTESFHTETLARMPDSQWCHLSYQELESIANLPPGLASISELPLLRNSRLTLGSFNSAAKLNNQVLMLWAEVMHAAPSARLLIAAIPSGRAQQRIISFLERSDVDCNRIEFAARLPYDEYLASITQVDIALDSFPYNGGATSIDILMMGVPLVTLAGDHSIARGGVSVLSNLGLMELIASSPEEYVAIVQRLANDPDRLAALRFALRERLQQSPLMDGARFTRNLEQLYRQMWRAWCAQENAGSAEFTGR